MTGVLEVVNVVLVIVAVVMVKRRVDDVDGTRTFKSCVSARD